MKKLAYILPFIMCLPGPVAYGQAIDLRGSWQCQHSSRVTARGQRANPTIIEFTMTVSDNNALEGSGIHVYDGARNNIRFKGTWAINYQNEFLMQAFYQHGPISGLQFFVFGAEIQNHSFMNTLNIVEGGLSYASSCQRLN